MSAAWSAASSRERCRRGEVPAQRLGPGQPEQHERQVALVAGVDRREPQAVELLARLGERGPRRASRSARSCSAVARAAAAAGVLERDRALDPAPVDAAAEQEVDDRADAQGRAERGVVAEGRRTLECASGVHVGGARVAEVVEVDVGEVELDPDRQSADPRRARAPPRAAAPPRRSCRRSSGSPASRRSASPRVGPRGVVLRIVLEQARARGRSPAWTLCSAASTPRRRAAPGVLSRRQRACLLQELGADSQAPRARARAAAPSSARRPPRRAASAASARWRTRSSGSATSSERRRCSARRRPLAAARVDRRGVERVGERDAAAIHAQQPRVLGRCQAAGRRRQLDELGRGVPQRRGDEQRALRPRGQRGDAAHHELAQALGHRERSPGLERGLLPNARATSSAKRGLPREIRPIRSSVGLE